MKKQLFFLCCCFITMKLFAQNENKKDIFVFTITDYIIDSNDSIKVVQIQLPQMEGLIIEKKQLGIVRHNYSNVTNDTAAIAWGKCQLIKNEYYYFGLHLYNSENGPQKNDLLYTYVNYPAKYKQQFYALVKNAVYFEHVTGGSFYSFDTPLSLDEKKENNLVDSLVADIKLTGREMQKQNDGQDQIINGGIFNNKKLFASMQTITAADVKKFLDYVIARPQKYAGNTWKIAETFATWMTSNTPTVIKQ